MTVNIDLIKNNLLERFKELEQIEQVEQSIAYVSKMIGTKKKDDKGNWVPKYNFNQGWLIVAIGECIEAGFGLDGINYVISGNSMYMPTYHAFKNKIYKVYPESQIDIQIIREDDEYSFAKESGSVIYTHSISDPFKSNESNIIGAYCVIRNKRGEFLETLNQTDFNKMKNSSKNPRLWDKWLSEFWKKSVIKRACKTHFHDITTTLEEQDNKVIGIKEMVEASEEHLANIVEAKKAENENRA